METTELNNFLIYLLNSQFAVNKCHQTGAYKVKRGGYGKFIIAYDHRACEHKIIEVVDFNKVVRSYDISNAPTIEDFSLVVYK
jgi:hypothetical protein